MTVWCGTLHDNMCWKGGALNKRLRRKRFAQSRADSVGAERDKNVQVIIRRGGVKFWRRLLARAIEHVTKPCGGYVHMLM